MPARLPDHAEAARRARVRTVLIFAGIMDLALAGFFLGWGTKLLQIEYRAAWMMAAALAAGGVIILFVATLGYGRRGTGRALDPGEEDEREPIVRR